jgi:hypothetical protein
MYYVLNFLVSELHGQRFYACVCVCVRVKVQSALRRCLNRLDCLCLVELSRVTAVSGSSLLEAGRQNSGCGFHGDGCVSTHLHQSDCQGTIKRSVRPIHQTWETNDFYNRCYQSLLLICLS